MKCTETAMRRNKGKWWVVVLVRTLGATKIKSNLQTGQYANSNLFDHNQVLWEPLPTTWGHQIYQQVPL